MNADRFGASIRALRATTSRRDIVRSLGAMGLGLGAIRLTRSADAKKKRRRKKRKRIPNAKPNFYGCAEVGDACATANDCCSGVCEGKKDKKTCQVHGAGTCDQETDGYCQAEDPEQTACNDVPGCFCWRTTAGSQFCDDFNGESGTDCANCRKDADCEALGFPTGSACAPVIGRNCNLSPCEMACLVPCGAEAP